MYWLITLLLSLSTGAQDFPASPQQELQQPEPQEAPAQQPIVLLTHAARLQESGCWATLYDNVELTGARLTLFDDVELSQLRLPDGSDWRGRVRSLQVGPDARVHLYGGPNFQDRAFAVAPARSLDGTITLPFTEIQSIRVTCVPR
jgi:hypothetical protein